MTDPSAPVRILVCDDQALVRTGYAAIFDAQPGLRVVGQVGDGRTAVETAVRLRPDVVIMDVRMPVLDGIEATRQLAGPETAGSPRVLVVTTFNLDDYVYRALRAGASGFLLKDATPEELVAGVRTVARGEALLDPAVTHRLIGRFAERLLPGDARPEAAQALDRLSPRELEVLGLIAEGLSNAEIAARMVLKPETVKTYVSRIFTKLDLRDRVHAVILAYRTGLVRPTG
ncbi:response regulator [Nocardiopsis halotolerans]|uniref:response regulator n=1 Tax=Nocardiopsis halotolerans TaxID=124252 RepID=UPI0003462CEC|nr:response regulator transcription factor [Nocardiopsis halotolerans]